jgi:hypothetical protein
VALHQLGADDLERILSSAEDSVLHQYESDFAGYGIKLQVDGPALRAIAERAHEERTGARGLMTVMERLFRDFKFELPSAGSRELEVNAEMVQEPRAALAQMLAAGSESQRERMRAEIAEFAARFRKEHGLELDFTPAAADALIELSLESDKTIRAIAEKRFRDLGYALKLVSRNTGRLDFRITKAAVHNPDRTISGWITKSYGRD